MSKDDWPDRLLHVPTWTSHRHWGNGIFNNITCPRYNIVSYTWGRWQQDDGDAIKVDGVTWQIPRIDPSHFTSEQFMNAIRRIIEGWAYNTKTRAEFIWLDVCCIDQEDKDMKAIEIGRQGLIFKKASFAYAWLTTFSTEELRETLKALIGLESTLESRRKAIERLLQDPYYSSLWTLQEAFLRDDALFLSREGEIIDIWFGIKGMDEDETDFDELYHFDDGSDSGTRHLSHGIASLDNVTEAVSKYMSDVTLRILGVDSDAEETSSTMDKLQRSGITALTKRLNPFLLYTTASFRTVHRPVDRVYAIMQIYELRLGESADQQHPVTLTELDDQLIEGFIDISPTWSQFFRHIRADSGASWRMGPSVGPLSFTLSTDLLAFTYSGSELAKNGGYYTQPILERRPKVGNIDSLSWKGLSCSLLTLTAYWHAALERKSDYGPMGFPYEFKVSMQFDVLKSDDQDMEQLPDQLPASIDSLKQTMKLLDMRFGLSEICILRLSKVPLYQNTYARVVWAWAGVIARRHHNGRKEHMRRIGVAVWDLHYFPELDMEEIEWQSCEVIVI